jgi:DivIVA domain-containing protein
VPLTPADIHNMEFARASLSKRGYDEEQVDALLDEVSQEMIKLLEENDLLQRRVRLETPGDRPTAAGDDVEAALSAAMRDLDRARHAFDRAERNAHQLRRELDEARQAAGARRAPAPAADNNDRVLAMAQRTADDHMQQAEQESQALIADARKQADRMVGEAQRMMSDLERDAHRQHTEAAAELQTRRTSLLREIEELTGLAEGYRAALEDHITRQSQQLDGADEQIPQEAAGV